MIVDKRTILLSFCVLDTLTYAMQDLFTENVMMLEEQLRKHYYEKQKQESQQQQREKQLELIRHQRQQNYQEILQIIAQRREEHDTFMQETKKIKEMLSIRRSKSLS